MFDFLYINKNNRIPLTNQIQLLILSILKEQFAKLCMIKPQEKKKHKLENL